MRRNHISSRKNSQAFYLILGLVMLAAVVFLFKGWQSASQTSSSVSLPTYNNISPAQPLPSPLTASSPSASASAKLLNLRLFFVALNDNGKNGEPIGCGDTVAPVNIQIPDAPNPLTMIMQQLLSLKQQSVGPSKLYNSLYQSELELKDASIKNGVAIIHLTGTTKLAGECDNPRFQTQLEKTAGQFSNVNMVKIFINDQPLSEVVSLR